MNNSNHELLTSQIGLTRQYRETYVIELDEKTHISTRIGVEILDIDSERIYGEIADIGDLPIPGNQIKAKVSRGSCKAVALVGEYEIKLSNSALASGTISLEIDSAPGEGLAEGMIESY